MTDEKTFGVIDEIYHTGANSSEKVFKEVTGEQILSGLRPDRDQDLKDFIANAKPGEYINWRSPIFRVR